MSAPRPSPTMRRWWMSSPVFLHPRAALTKVRKRALMILEAGCLPHLAWTFRPCDRLCPLRDRALLVSKAGQDIHPSLAGELGRLPLPARDRLPFTAATPSLRCCRPLGDKDTLKLSGNRLPVASPLKGSAVVMSTGTLRCVPNRDEDLFHTARTSTRACMQATNKL